MAVKSNFASGDVLTASDVNTYLTNGGLVYIKDQAIGTAVNTQNVTSCFSSTYDNYYVEVSGMTASANTSIVFSLLTGTTLNSSNWAGNTFYVATAAAGALSNFNFTGVGSTECGSVHTASTNAFSFWVYAPYLATYTRLNFTSMDNNSFRFGSGLHKASTSYDGMKLDMGVNTMTGGKIRVYGYRQA